jgi:hypothetical protein
MGRSEIKLRCDYVVHEGLYFCRWVEGAKIVRISVRKMENIVQACMGSVTGQAMAATGTELQGFRGCSGLGSPPHYARTHPDPLQSPLQTAWTALHKESSTKIQQVPAHDALHCKSSTRHLPEAQHLLSHRHRLRTTKCPQSHLADKAAPLTLAKE